LYVWGDLVVPKWLEQKQNLMDKQVLLRKDGDGVYSPGTGHPEASPAGRFCCGDDYRGRLWAGRRKVLFSIPIS
jgi:hypothetical protein